MLINSGRLRQTGLRSLSPIGGGLQVSDNGRKYLECLGAVRFEGDSNDLRFNVPDAQVPQVVAWFEKRVQRETSVLRELDEELVDESGALTRSDLRGVTERLSSFHRYYGEVARTDVPDRRTTYLVEIFDVTLRRSAMGKLVQAARIPRSQRWVYFVTPREIRDKKAFDGTRISDMAQYLPNQ